MTKRVLMAAGSVAAAMALALGTATSAHADAWGSTVAGGGFAWGAGSFDFTSLGENLRIHDHKADGAGVVVMMEPDGGTARYYRNSYGAGTYRDFNLSYAEGTHLWITVCVSDNGKTISSTCAIYGAVA
ncbi:hypothetical protein ACL02R_10105 [Streptomyces sp. MS19]|uniref:hypothetical protein n=1 Tax=Streptomyces sp. MS19 TaxID=3385972 RepID=UPI0039A3A4FF